MKVPLSPRAQVTTEGWQGQLGVTSPTSAQILAHHSVLAGEMLVPTPGRCLSPTTPQDKPT